MAACIHHPDTQFDNQGRRLCGGCGSVWDDATSSWVSSDGSADYSPSGPRGEVQARIDPADIGTACKCFFHPDAGMTPHHKLVLGVFGLACYGVLMTEGKDLDLRTYSNAVIERYRHTLNVILDGANPT